MRVTITYRLLDNQNESLTGQLMQLNLDFIKPGLTTIKTDDKKLTSIADHRIVKVELLEGIPEWLIEDWVSEYNKNTSLLHTKMTKEQHRLGLDQ